MRPLLPTFEEVSPWLQQMDRSRVYTNLGPLVAELEARHAERLGVDPGQVVSAANATLALTGAIALSEVDVWLVPDFTFPASGHAVLQAGRHLKLMDVREHDWQLDVSSVKPNSNIGIMPVLPFGAGLELQEWSAFPNVVVDAAASLGSPDWDLSDLPDGWSVIFSLHATKTLPAGEGGLVVFGSKERARQFRAWSNFGFAGSRLSTLVATNAKMSEITAAYGLASLARWGEEEEEWTKNLSLANEITVDLGLETPVQRYRGVHPYWMIQLASDKERDIVTKGLSSFGIETRQWWPAPLHSMPAFRDADRASDSPISSQLAATTLGLPMFRGLSTDQIAGIGAKVKDVLHSHRTLN